MKKRFFLLAIAAGIYISSVQAQTTKPGPCDSLREMYDMALYFLDSTVGNQNELRKQLDSAHRALSETKRQNAEQAKKITQLEAEIKRLSAPAKTPKQKGG